MNLLLDTHTLLYWHAKTAKLSASVRAVLDDPANTVYISAVNAWEIQIKHQLGKLPMPRPLTDLIAWEQRVNGFALLDVTLQHVFALDQLPMLHNDPFDRLLIAQALHEDLTLVTRDQEIIKYIVPTLW